MSPWRRLFLLAVLVLAPGVGLLFGLHLWLAGVAWLLALGLAPRWRRPRLVGPLFYYDLVRLSRRGRSTALRCSYGLALLFALAWFYAGEFRLSWLDLFSFDRHVSLSLSDLAGFGHRFMLTVLVVQSLAILLLTPAYLCGVIAEERERNTLELLFTTHLTNREIIFDRLLARLTHLGAILLTGLPILSLTTLWGVDPVIVLASFAATGLSLFSVGSVAIFCSVISATVLSAEIKGYGMVLGGTFACAICCLSSPLGFVASPATFALELESRLRGETIDQRAPTVPASRPAAIALAMLGTYALAHGAIGFLFSLVAVNELRAAAARHPDDVLLPLLLPGHAPPAPQVEAALASFPRLGAEPWRPRQYVGEPALLWKEAFFNSTNSMGRPPGWNIRWETELESIGITFISALLAVLALVFIGMPIAWDKDVQAIIQPILRGLTCLAMAVWTVGLSFRIAGSVTRERERKTLVDLLMLPEERSKILWWKWLGGMLRQRFWGHLLVAIWTVGLLLGGLHPLSFVLLTTTCVVHLAFLASTALWLSVYCRTTLRSNMVMALALLLFYAGGYVFLVKFRYAPPLDWQTGLGQIGLNPVGSWLFLAFSRIDFLEWMAGDARAFRFHLASAGAGLGLFGLATGLLWLTAVWRFRREEGG